MGRTGHGSSVAAVVSNCASALVTFCRADLGASEDAAAAVSNEKARCTGCEAHLASCEWFNANLRRLAWLQHDVSLLL